MAAKIDSLWNNALGSADGLSLKDGKVKVEAGVYDLRTGTVTLT
jgi:hypothetical protein